MLIVIYEYVYSMFMTIVPNTSLFSQKKKKNKKMFFVMLKLVRPEVKMTITGDIFSYLNIK